MSEDANAEPCEWCGDGVADPLARTLRVTVDRSQIDSLYLCPECFANWIDRYEAEMTPETEESTVDTEDGDTDIIVD